LPVTMTTKLAFWKVTTWKAGNDVENNISEKYIGLERHTTVSSRMMILVSAALNLQVPQSQSWLKLRVRHVFTGTMERGCGLCKQKYLCLAEVPYPRQVFIWSVLCVLNSCIDRLPGVYCLDSTLPNLVSFRKCMLLHV
jgi:hypothetical protein